MADNLPDLTDEETKAALEAARKLKAAAGAAPRVFGAVATVKVKSDNKAHEGGYYEVSVDDYLEGVHELYVEPEAKPVKVDEPKK
jgi:hypothetical protein